MIADSTMTYRRRYMSSLQTAPVLDLLLADEANPRSLAYQLAALAESIDQLPRDESAPGRGEEQRIILTTLTRLRVADIDQLAQADASGTPARARGLLARLEGEIPVLSDALTRSYFSHLQLSRQFSKSGERGRRDPSTMIYKIVHNTHYSYVKNVSLCHNLVHLTARSCAWQTCRHNELQVSSPPVVSNTRTDYFGNP